MKKSTVSGLYSGDLFSGVGGIEICISHSKESLLLQLARLQASMKAGQRDYERFLIDEKAYRYAAAKKSFKSVVYEGSTWSVKQSQYMVQWALQWSQQLANMRYEESELVKKIDAFQ